jgi:hypothetical protein
MRRSQFMAMFGLLSVCVVSGVMVWDDGSSAVAQTSKAKTKPGVSKKSSAESKELDVRAEKNLDNFLNETAKLAEDFEKAGKYEEAQDQMRTILRLKPDLPGIKERLEKLNQALFENNEHDLEQDVKEGWAMRVLVSKGKPVRVESTGEYTLAFNLKVDGGGVSTKDPGTDMVAGVRCGALMGMVYPLPDPNKPPSKNDKVGEPFEIGTSKEFTPKEDGALLLRVNLPPGHKCIGKLKVRVSGHIKPLPKELR